MGKTNQGPFCTNIISPFFLVFFWRKQPKALFWQLRLLFVVVAVQRNLARSTEVRGTSPGVTLPPVFVETGSQGSQGSLKGLRQNNTFVQPIWCLTELPNGRPRGPMSLEQRTSRWSQRNRPCKLHRLFFSATARHATYISLLHAWVRSLSACLCVDVTRVACLSPPSAVVSANWTAISSRYSRSQRTLMPRRISSWQLCYGH